MRRQQRRRQPTSVAVQTPQAGWPRWRLRSDPGPGGVKPGKHLANMGLQKLDQIFPECRHSRSPLPYQRFESMTSEITQSSSNIRFATVTHVMPVARRGILQPDTQEISSSLDQLIDELEKLHTIRMDELNRGFLSGLRQLDIAQRADSLLRHLELLRNLPTSDSEVESSRRYVETITPLVHALCTELEKLQTLGPVPLLALRKRILLCD